MRILQAASLISFAFAHAGLARASDFNWDTTSCISGSSIAFSAAFYNTTSVQAPYYFAVGGAYQNINPTDVAERPAGGCSNCPVVKNWRPFFSIPSYTAVHFGVSIAGTNLKPPVTGRFVTSMNPSYVEQQNCSPLVLAPVIHNGDKVLDLGFSGPEGTSIVLVGASAEYYSSHQPLETLNLDTERHPVSVESIEITDAQIDPAETINLHYDPPAGAKFVVFALEATAADDDNNISRVWAQYPLDEPTKARPCGILGLIPVAAMVLGLTLMRVRRIR
jgi:hypothetical protein